MFDDQTVHIDDVERSVGTEVDPRSKTPAFKSVPVWIEASAG